MHNLKLTPFKSRWIGVCSFLVGLVILAISLDYSDITKTVLSIIGAIGIISGIGVFYILGRCPECNMVNPFHFGKHCVYCGADMDKKDK
jgi:hypothetical protein